MNINKEILMESQIEKWQQEEIKRLESFYKSYIGFLDNIGKIHSKQCDNMISYCDKLGKIIEKL